MSTLVYVLQSTIVFGVPTLFGWVLLRRVFREGNLVVLCPAAVVLGMATLMAIVNELRFFLEMRVAIWFTYKLLLGLALLFAVVFPARAPFARLPGATSRPWRILVVVIGAIFSSAYFGIPALKGILNDAWWFHYPAAVQIQTVALFPFTHVFAPDDPLYYHYGPDLLAASWSLLLDEPVQTAFAQFILILAPCSFLLAFALVERLSRNYWSAIFGAVFLIVGGNMRFLLFLTGKYSTAIGALRVFDSQVIQGLLQMIFTPAHAFGVPLLLTALLLFRHVCVRPTLCLAAVFGLFLGTFTLVSEWYFLPLLAGLVFVMLRSAFRLGPATQGRIMVAVLPVVIAVAWGAFNDSYLSGIIAHFWIGFDNISDASQTRMVIAESQSLEPRSTTLGSTIITTKPKWVVPDLVPLRLNLSHLGAVPSWESAGSTKSSFVTIYGPQFLMEMMPIVAIGIPFAFYMAWRRASANIVLLAWITISSAMPPILLDWGYRSTDFLRFFTASFSFAALFLGWLVGILMVKSPRWQKALGAILVLCCLTNPIGLGIVGLLPGNLDTVRHLSSTAGSLSTYQAALRKNHKLPADTGEVADESSDPIRSGALERLATQTGDFLFTIAKGRERAIIIVPTKQLPKVERFPEWMKMATYSRLPIPVGTHWNESLYSAYYRNAVSNLDPTSLTALGAKWVIVSNLFQDSVPPGVAIALSDTVHFRPVVTFRDGRYFMTSYKIRP